MMTCPDEAILQSYLDGELSARRAETVAAHVYSCATCLVAIDQIKSETFLLDASFEQTFSAQTPTERLRARLCAAVAAQNNEMIASVEQSPHGSNRLARWRRAFAAFFILPNMRRSAFACVGVAMLIGSFLFFVQSRRATLQVVMNKTETHFVVPEPDTTNAPPEIQDTQSLAVNILTRATNNARREVTAPVAKLMGRHRTNLKRVPDELLAADTAELRHHPASITEFLPGEQSYLKAIASLSAALEVNDEKTSSPTRIEYKRDLAIVDQAINATRREAIRHPGDADATEFVLAAYQSKLDLLDTIANASR